MNSNTYLSDLIDVEDVPKAFDIQATFLVVGIPLEIQKSGIFYNQPEAMCSELQLRHIALCYLARA